MQPAESKSQGGWLADFVSHLQRHDLAEQAVAG
jgi:hypothetical protein